MSEPGADGLSVIMVSYKTGPVLFESIEAVLAEPRVTELIIVNHDNSRADVYRLVDLDKTEPRVTLVMSGGNLGFSKGCNIGAAQASGSRLLFLNPDTILQPGAAAALIETLDAAAEPAVVGARITHLDGTEQRGARRGELTVFSALATFLGLSRALHREGEALPNAAEPVPAVSGAAMALSRVGFDALGGFDEAYFLHVEDLDICRRARDLGGAVMFEPRAEVRHHRSTSRVSPFKVEHWKAAGLVRYFHTHGGVLGPVKAALVAPLIYVGLMGRALLARLKP
jgi:N-acetylglucosaminyl-diphospho-decaprenol L-rhamnosyltransferase